ncbi:MAG: SH3 domain-containing protein [Aggregatilineales bacterium]
MNIRFRLVTLATAGLMATSAIGFGAVSPALAQSSTPVTVPVMVGVNTTTTVYDAPNANSDQVGQLVAGQTWFVLGTDSTGKWVEVFITPSISGWVPASTLGLGGMTLPTIAGFSGGPTVASNPAPSSAPTQHFTIALGSTALVGVNTTTNVYDAPSNTADLEGQLVAGQTWFVLGQDTSGKWAEVQITPSIFGWVASSALDLQSLTLPVIPGF